MKKKWGRLFAAGLSVLCLLIGCGRENGSAGNGSTETGSAETESAGSGSIETGSGSAGTAESPSEGTRKAKDGDRFTVDPEETAKELESPEQPEFEKEDVRGIAVAEDGQVVCKINYTPRPDRESYLYWDMMAPYSSTAVVDTEAMYGFYETVAGLDLSKDAASKDAASKDAASKDAASKDAASKDAASKDAASKDTASKEEEAHAELSDSDTYITVNYYNPGDGGEQKTEPNETLTLLIGEETDGQYHCSLKGHEERCIMLDASAVNAILRQDPYDLILKIPYVVNMATVQEVDISYQGKDYRMTLEGETYRIQDKEVEMEEYRKLFSELMQPMLDGRIPEEELEKLKEGREPLISIDYIRNLDEANDYIVRIYPYEGGRYTVSVNGEEHFFLAAEDVKTLEGVLREAFIL